ncbi:MAG TPA: DUF4432 family protein [Candidatus Baltobacteraceae bacterium]|nr:DUF4432 family protein [Candidatus Baltobacteraceae bacterium]
MVLPKVYQRSTKAVTRRNGSGRKSNARLDAGRGVSLTLRYRPDQLPALMTWRMLGVGTYVMAMEPANCPTIEGRTAARDLGTLPFLEPGETRQYDLEFSVRTLAPESSHTRS